MRIAILVSFVLGCVPQQSQPSYFGSQPQPGYGAAPPAPGYAAPVQTASGGASCIEVFQCLAACTEQTCYQPCYERGTPEAQQAAAAVIQCGQGGGACEAEFATCRNQGGVAVASAPAAPSAPTSAPVQIGGKRAPVANSQILPYLTGSWIGNNHQFEFYGDGRVRRSSGGMMYETTAGDRDHARQCVNVNNDVGTVTQQGDYLIMTFGGSDSYTCGTREKAPGVTVRYLIEWVDNPYYELNELQLYLRDLDCERQSDAMYCNDRVRRR